MRATQRIILLRDYHILLPASPSVGCGGVRSGVAASARSSATPWCLAGCMIGRMRNGIKPSVRFWFYLQTMVLRVRQMKCPICAGDVPCKLLRSKTFECPACKESLRVKDFSPLLTIVLTITLMVCGYWLTFVIGEQLGLEGNGLFTVTLFLRPSWGHTGLGDIRRLLRGTSWCGSVVGGRPWPLTWA